MALDLDNKDMSTGQVVLSTYDIDSNSVRVLVTGGEVEIDTTGLATEAKQDDQITELQNITVAIEELGNVTAVGTPVYHDYSSGNVTTAAYTTLVGSMPAQCSQVEIFDSSGQSLYLAVGAAASEQNKIIVVPGGNGKVPLEVSAATRLSIKALTANATSGYIVINFYR